jgi:mannose-6-phosphate isomerase-like protein (cupin superfamily)
MHVTRHEDAQPYETRGHFGMAALRLQGHAASPCADFWVGLSHFLPGGGAEDSASNVEKVYVLLSGEVVVVTDDGEATLRPMDSCHLAAGERRAIINRRNTPASMLVIMSYQKPAA